MNPYVAGKANKQLRAVLYCSSGVVGADTSVVRASSFCRPEAGPNGHKQESMS